MIRKLRYVPLLFVILCGCNSEKNNAVVDKVEPDHSDTTIYLTVNSVTKLYKISKELRLNFNEFRNFLNKYPTVPATYHDTVRVDITGDGIEEKVISKIETTNGNCTIFSKIVMGEQLIFCDTLKADNDLAFIDWASDSVYFALKPYSSFYDALREKDIIEELDSGKIDNDLIDFYVSGLDAQLRDKGTDSVRIKIMTDSVIYDLRNYHGKFVTSLEHWDRSLLIWNQRSGKLELLYAP